MPTRMRTPRRTAAIGDALVVALVVAIGFVFHGEPTAVGRMALTVLAFWVAWFVVAYHMGLFDEAALLGPWEALWRTGVAWAVAAPLGAVLRTLLVGSQTVAVIFVVVIAALNTVGTGLWRVGLAVWNRRIQAADRELGG